VVAELPPIAAALNDLLDQRLTSHEPEGAASRAAERAALRTLLDAMSEPVLVLSRVEELVAANAAGLDRFAALDAHGLADLRAHLHAGEATPLAGLARVTGLGGGAFLVVLG